MTYRLVAGLLLAAAVVLLVAGIAAAYAEIDRGVKLGPGPVPAFVPLGGLCFMCLGAGVAARVLPHVLRGRVTAGRVVKVSSVDDGFQAVVQYSVDGAMYEVTSVVGSCTAAGDKVGVLYLPDDPGNGQVKSWRLYTPVLFIGMGAVVVGVWAFS